MMEQESDCRREDVSELAKSIAKRLKRLYRKREKQIEELRETRAHAWYRQVGDSLLANPAILPRGASKATILNIHTQKEELIAANPRLDAAKNAALFYKKARKAQRGNEINEKKVAQTEKEIAEFEGLVQECEALSGETPAPDLISRALLALERFEPRGSLPPSPADREAAQCPYRRITIDEWNIYIGKNDRQNDELTTRFAKPRDLWLHVAGHAGSHVLIRRPDRTAEVPPEVIQKAASLAVWFSKAKHTSYAEVHLTEARFVHKRRHSPPGEVIAERCKALRVSPKSPHELFPSRFDEMEDERASG